MRSTADIEGLRSVFCAIDHVASEINICSVIMYCIQANTRRSRPNSFIVLCWPQQLNSLQYDDQGLLLSRGLIQDVSTRWNRTFYILERLSLLRWSVVAVLYDQSLTKPQEARVLEMHAESWKLAEEIVLVLRKVELATVLFSSQSKTTSGVVLPAITGLVQQLKAMTFRACERWPTKSKWATTPPGQNFRDTLVQSLTDRFVLDQLDVTGEETVTCEAVPFYLLASFMDPRFRDLSFLSEAERKALVDFASQTVKVMPLPSLPARSDVAVTSTSQPEILPPPKKKSKSELAMEELLGKGKSCNSSQGSTGEEVESREEKIDKEIHQLHNETPIGLTEDPLEWWKENENVTLSYGTLPPEYWQLRRRLCQASRFSARLKETCRA